MFSVTMTIIKIQLLDVQRYHDNNKIQLSDVQRYHDNNKIQLSDVQRYHDNNKNTIVRCSALP